MADRFIGKWAFPSDDSLLEQSARRGVQYDFEKIAADIIDKVQFEKNDIVLDVCCGNAALAQLILKHCSQIHGVDHSEKLIASAGKSPLTPEGGSQGIHSQDFPPSGGLRGALHLHLADALEIDKLFSESKFDKSYCYFSFQYFNKKKRELLLEKLSFVTKPNGSVFIGDIPDKTRIWNFYESKMKFYKEKISRLIQFKEGECDLGWWIEPKEILDWCSTKKLSASILSQKNLPHAHYRFDVLIQNCK